MYQILGWEIPNKHKLLFVWQPFSSPLIYSYPWKYAVNIIQGVHLFPLKFKLYYFRFSTNLIFEFLKLGTRSLGCYSVKIRFISCFALAFARFCGWCLLLWGLWPFAFNLKCLTSIKVICSVIGKLFSGWLMRKKMTKQKFPRIDTNCLFGGNKGWIEWRYIVLKAIINLASMYGRCSL